ncbi:MAG: acyl-CoA dehydrogenase [Smithellaceae bacterium]|nr:acyl-CoA dehydrogenase [Smithellaceae bacterium]
MEFRYDIRDLKFILREWLPAEEVFQCERFRNNYSIDDVDMYLNEGYKIAREVVSPINAPGDRAGVKLENGVVTPAPGYAEVYKFLQANGWGSSSECLETEGGMPLILYKMIHELNTAACPAVTSYIKLTSGAVNLITLYGTDEDKALFLPKMLQGDWQGTMCLSEPDAGSDVGDIITRAFPTDDPRIYKIQGTKIFITGGDPGGAENTIHMVLARPEGGAAGSPGLGLYIVPRVRVNRDGTLGRSNDVSTVSLEHKMGLKAQATALLNFGENDACCGIQLGPPPDEQGRSRGLAMMFHMMNESRIGTGHNANCQAAAAYCFASRYARERIQGRPFGVKDGPRVPIVQHEDIRRMLLDMKSHTEGIRAMIFKGFYYLDLQANGGDAVQAREAGALAEIYTPLVKCYASEMSLQLIAEAIQVLGGVGYTREYPVEQYLRDSKVLTIWEGTSFIHGQDLVNRKMRMDGGAPFMNWMNLINDFIDKNRQAAGFEREMANLEQGLGSVRTLKSLYDSWFRNFVEKRQFIPLNAVKTLFVCAQVQVAQCLMEQALVAKRNLETLPEGDGDQFFYRGKIASARYYLNQILPQVLVQTEIIQQEERMALEVPEEVFFLS